MKSLAFQVLALAALAAAAGGAANLTYGLLGKDSDAYARHLEWWPRHYANATVVEGCEARAARRSGVAAGSRGAPDVPDVPDTPAAPGGSREAPEPPATGSEPSGVATPGAPVADDEVEDDAAAGNETAAAGADVDGGKAGDAHARFPMIEIAEFREEFLAGSLIIDARRTKAYVAGHVPGAISIPAWEHPGERINELLERGAVLEAPTVVYCTRSEECEDSEIVCGLLEQAGFLDLRIFKGGFPEWQANEPDAISTGEEPGTLDPSTLQEGSAE